MITRRFALVAGASALAGSWMARGSGTARAAEAFPVTYSEAEWRSRLSPQQFAVLRQSATERPYTSPLDKEKRRGTFACAGCDQDLFSSAAKFDSGTGWPSFWAPIAETAIGTERDTTLGMLRVAVHCSRCGGHLGHVFEDGPPPTGLRYCMNGVAMAFKPLNA